MTLSGATDSPPPVNPSTPSMSTLLNDSVYTVAMTSMVIVFAVRWVVSLLPAVIALTPHGASKASESAAIVHEDEKVVGGGEAESLLTEKGTGKSVTVAEAEYRVRRGLERRRILIINYITYLLLMGLAIIPSFVAWILWFQSPNPHKFDDVSAFMKKSVCIMLVSLYLMQLFSETFGIAYVLHHVSTVIIVCLLIDFADKPKEMNIGTIMIGCALTEWQAYLSLLLHQSWCSLLRQYTSISLIVSVTCVVCCTYILQNKNARDTTGKSARKAFLF